MEELLLYVIAVLHLRMTSLQGILRGFDQLTNVILEQSKERVFSAKEGVTEVPCGLYVIRGDNVYVPRPALPTTHSLETS